VETTEYLKLDLKKPIESPDYAECSDFVVGQIEAIINAAIESGRNKIIINTNLKLGLPMENINKVAGPFVEAWAFEIFSDVLEDENNKYQLINVEAGERLNMADVILQFKRKRKTQSSVTGYVDVKATSNDIAGSGKSPNITSFARISYNPALGSGQLQVRDIHYVTKELRSTWEFCQLLDEKCIASRKEFSEWLRYAEQHQWIKGEL